MKIAYVSNFRLDMPSLGEYSEHFLRVLSSIDGAEVTCLDLGEFVHQSSAKVRRKATNRILDFDASNGGFDIYYLEIINHHHMVWLVTSLRKNLGRAKIIATIHDPPLPVTGYMQMYFPSSGRLWKKAARLLDMLGISDWVISRHVKYCDGMVFLTTSGQESFVRRYHYNGQCLLLPHVNFNADCDMGLTVQCPSKSDTLSVFYAGHWWKHKGIEDLIDACMELSRRGLKIDLCLSGSGPPGYVEHIASYLESRQHPGLTVDMPGLIEIDEMYRRGRAANCWVVPYRHTGKVAGSGVIARAMYAGAHLVVSDLPQILDILKDGKDCEAYRAGDVADLAEKIAQSGDSEKSRMLRTNLLEKNNTIHSKAALADQVHKFIGTLMGR